VLRDGAGERFMVGAHPLAELAPRDVVAKAITRVQLRDGVDHVWLDARGFPGLAQRFPTIVARCRQEGIDPVTDLVRSPPPRTTPPAGWPPTWPGAPRSPGSTPAARWPAPACTGQPAGVELAAGGAGLRRRIGADLARSLPPATPAVAAAPATGGLLDPAGRRAVTDTMSGRVAALRSGAGLAEATGALAGLAASLAGGPGAAPGVDSWEATGLLTVASALTAAAASREETRGCHWREDHPDSEEQWRVHLDVRLDGSGRLSLTRRPVGTPLVAAW
jgi:L-aspartate oxidase